MKLRKLYAANAIVNFIISLVTVAACVLGWVLVLTKVNNVAIIFLSLFGMFPISIVAVGYVIEKILVGISILRAIKKEQTPPQGAFIVQMCLLFLPANLCLFFWGMTAELSQLFWIYFALLIAATLLDTVAYVLFTVNHRRARRKADTPTVEEAQSDDGEVIA